jgi:hypothetical protein
LATTSCADILGAGFGDRSLAPSAGTAGAIGTGGAGTSSQGGTFTTSLGSLANASSGGSCSTQRDATGGVTPLDPVTICCLP